MKRLPVEILQKIFTLFHQQEKVECMLTCQHWANVIKNFNLFSTIQLSDLSKWTELMERWQHKPSERAQVEDLILNFYFEGEFDYTFLSSFFPRLRMFYVLGCHNLPLRNNSVQQQQLGNEHIQYMAETFSHELAFNMLSSGLCCNLRTLSIRASNNHTSSQSIITLLKNTPNLSELAMAFFEISFNDMELLHTMLPTSLTCIQLTSAGLADVSISTEIKPATTVTKFVLETPGASIQIQQEWLHYINIKYTHLSTLKFRYPMSWDNQISQISDRTMVHVSPFGSQLKSLLIRMNNSGLDLLRILDDAGCQLEKLDISIVLEINTLSVLLHSNQAKYIHTLKIDGIESSGFDWLNEFPVLKQLTLVARLCGGEESDRKKRIELKTLLEVCGNRIESLCIQGGGIVVDITNRCVYRSIKKISFSYQKLPFRMDYFLSKSLPNLQDIRLIHCGLSGKIFNLQNHHLACVEIAEGVLFKDTHLLLLTEKEQRWYTAKQCYSHYHQFKKHLRHVKNMPPYLTAKSVVYDVTWEDQPTLAFKCASVNRLFVLR